MSNKQNAKIVIVDDEISNVELLEGMLTREGYTTYKSLTDPRLVVPTYKEWQPDLILLDIMMPHMDGFAVIEALKDIVPKDDFLPILVLTADLSIQTKKRTLSSGAMDFVTKPFDIVEVMLRIRNLLHARALHKELQNQNITLEEKVVERTAELRKSNERFSRLLSEMNDVVWISSKDGSQILEVNNAFVEVYGIPKRTLESNPRLWLDMVHSDDRAIAEKSGRELLEKGRATVEYRILRPDGMIRYILDRKYILKDEHGNPVEMGGIAMDITDRKRAIEKQRILEAELQQAQKLESIGTLAGGIAHDFNNILGIIVAYGSLLQRGKISPQDQKEYTDTMMQAAQRGAALVKQILTFARKSDVSVESVQVNYVIKELMSMLHQAFPKTIDLSVDLDKSLPMISIDSGQLNQVLMNLCVNARDAILEANKAGKLPSTISIRTAKVTGEVLRRRFSTASSEQYVSISVSDTGVGMDENTKQRVFEPFFTTKEQGKGTGLGLAVVYGIVQDHKGIIDLESEIGKGTTFSIYFPVPKDVSAGALSVKKEVAEISGGSETVLVIEDEEALRMLLKNLLEAKGYTVIAAADGLEGVALFEKHRDQIAAVVSDHGLPGMTGADAVRKMIAAKPGVKCIIASGYIDPKQKSEIYKSGVKEFIQKPYDPLEIVRKVREVLDLK